MDAQLDYHQRQFVTPYRSTIAFEQFVGRIVRLGG